MIVGSVAYVDGATVGYGVKDGAEIMVPLLPEAVLDWIVLPGSSTD